MAVIPSLFNSAECWINLPKAAVQKLNKLFETFYSVMLNSPASCPKPGLYWFTGGILPSNKIMERKLLFLFHLINLDQNTLGYEVLDSQRRFEMPGLWQECLEYLRELDISIEELEELSKFQFKSRVREATREKNRRDLLRWIEPYKKLNVIDLSKEKFETKPYFFELSLSKARTKFSIDIQMLKTVKSHFPLDKTNEEALWKCGQCSRVDSIRHLMRCPFFSDIRANKNLHTNIEDMVTYFQEIVTYRLEQAQNN